MGTIIRFGFTLLISTLCILGVQAQEDFIWQDPSRDREERIEALLKAMTLEEKVSQMKDVSEGIPRLGIPTYNWWNECLHGVARNGKATVFPQAIGMGATFDTELIKNVANAIGKEARAKFNIAQKMENRSRYAGLTFWSPNVNIFRDPRWGRGQETYGEDPFLSGKMGTNFVKGLQGDDEKYLQAAACAKHYAVHSGPEEDRHVFDAVPTQKDLYETYLPAFEMLVREGNVEAVMGAYNRVFGEPACGSDLLLQKILRDDWGFEGHVVSDCGAIQDFYAHHKVSANAVEAAALAAKSGVDLNCGNVYGKNLITAIQKGLITEEVVDQRLRKLLATKFKLGLFDPVEMNPYNKVGEEVVESKEHRQLAREAATKSIVLLKNKNNVLPLKKDIRNLYVVGPNASSGEVLLGNYYGLSSNMTTILEGVVGHVSTGTTINYKQGILLDRANVNPIDWSTGEAGAADACIAVMGISGLLEGEEGEAIASKTKGDRLDIRLPQNQIDYLKKIRAKGNNPLIVVITGGSPMNLSEVAEIADAVVLAWYPGQEGGDAVADVLFGDVSPSGKLPLTFVKSLEQLPSYDDYSMEGRTYRYMTKEPLYPFGYGLSYTTFEYSPLKLDKKKVKSADEFTVTLTVKNTGEKEAEEVVQLYLSDYNVDFLAPNYSLKGFQRIKLKAGESKEVTFVVPSELRKVYNDKGEAVYPRGELKVTVGNASPLNRSKELGAVLQEAVIKVTR